MKSFFSKVWAFLTKAFSNTTWEQAVISTLNVVGPLIESIVAFSAGSAAEAIVKDVIDEISRDLSTLMGLVQAYQVGDHSTITARIEAIVGEVKTNLGTLLADAHIKDAGLTSKVTGVVTVVSGELDAILKSVPAPTVASATITATA